jgi:hypothetical protein
MKPRGIVSAIALAIVGALRGGTLTEIAAQPRWNPPSRARNRKRRALRGELARPGKPAGTKLARMAQERHIGTAVIR